MEKDLETMEPSEARQPAQGLSKNQKLFMIAVVAMVAFYFTYSYAQSNSQLNGYSYGGRAAGGNSYATGASPGGAYAGAGGTGGGCCGGGGGPQITKETTVQNGKQVVDMTVNNGWNPNAIKAKANIPLTINLDVQQAGGCVSALVFQSLNTGVQLQSGTKQKLELPALQPGTYQFSCQMGMINGQLVVE